MTALALAPIEVHPVDRRGDVATDMRAMALRLYDDPTAVILPGAIAWLTGRHEGYGDPSLWAELPSWQRTRMEGAAGDLGIGMPHASRDAAFALAEAAALICPEED